MRRPGRPALALLPILAALAVLAPAAAQARVMLVAAGDATATLVDVSSGTVVARVPVAGRTRGVAVAPDGVRGYVAAGAGLAAIDLNRRVEVGDLALTGTPTALAISASGRRLVAARKGALDVVDPATFTILRTARLGPHAERPSAVAVSADATKAVVVLDAKRIAIVDLLGGGVHPLHLEGVTGVAFAPSGRLAYAATATKKHAALTTIDTTAGHVTRTMPAKPGPGGGVAVTTDGRQAIVGAGPRARVTAVFDLKTGKVVRRVAAGRGPGHPAVAPDGVRLYIADQASGTISVFSALSFRRLSLRRLGTGAQPTAITVQPGLAQITGTDDAERLTGTRGADRIDALGGDDTVLGGRGADLLYGGPGNDTVDGGGSSDQLFGDDGDDRLFDGAGDDTLDGGAGNDYANAGSGNDTVDGGDGDDTVYGGNGDDAIIEKGLGNDFLLDGGPGNDYIDGNRGDDVIQGDAGNDTLRGGTGSEKLDGGDGDDQLDGGPGGDHLYGRAGNDVLTGDADRDTLSGSDGDDSLDGGSGDDKLSGGNGADDIVAGPGADVVTGGSGDDAIRVADGDKDTVDCGSGRDTVYVEQDAPARDALRGCETVIPVAPEGASDTAPKANNIFGNDYDDLLVGTDGPDSLFGHDGDDVLYGAGGDDYVDGENGDDELHGGPGSDDLHGRADDDVILGNEGDDTITGDRGADTINGGPGNDAIAGNLDPDVISGDEGDDRIQVVGGGIDRVSCGPGTDTVFADATDVVMSDCEIVHR